MDELREKPRICLKGHEPSAVVRIQIQRLIEDISLLIVDGHDAAVHFYEIHAEIDKRPTQVLHPHGLTAIATVVHAEIREGT